MANKITVMLEALGFDKATSDVKGFRQSVSDADGVTGKFKAGASSAFDSIKANAGPALLGAGAALVAFGVQAVGAFVDTAKAAIDMGAATGLATEDASRWIAVADDFGIGADQLEAGLGKIGKTLDSGKWEKYGVATRDAAGNARNANDVLIDSLDMLGKIPNATERARVGNELFGKGYANLAPLIGKTADEYKDMLGAVEDGQVITQQEAEKAERMRLAQDALSDALQEVTLALGEMVAEMAPAIEQTAELVGWLTKLGDVHIPGLPKEFTLMTGQITYAQEAWKVLTNEIDTKVSPATVALGEKIRAANAELQRQREDAVAAAYGVGEYAYQTEEVTDSLSDMEYQQRLANEAAQEGARRTAELDLTLQGLFGTIDADDALASLKTSYQEAMDAGTAAWTANAEGAEDAAAKTADAEQKTRDYKRETIEFAAEVLRLPPERITEIAAQIDNGQFAEVEAQLTNLARLRNAYINVATVYDGGAGRGGGNLRQTASGGPVRAGEETIVNDGGRPEVWQDSKGRTHALFPDSGHVIGNGMQPVGAGRSGPLIGQVIVNYPVEADSFAQRLNMMLATS